MPGTEKPVVVFLNHWSKHLGGAEYSLYDILAVAHTTMTCHLIVSEPGPLVDKANALGITCHIVPCRSTFTRLKRGRLLVSLFRSWKDIGAFIRYVFSIRARICALHPRCVHANVPKSHVALFLIAHFGYTGPCCFHVREIFQQHSLSYYLYALLFPKKHGAGIAISHAVKQALPRSLRTQTTVIYNGVYVPDTVTEHPADTPVRLLYLGRIVPWKGCHLLIECLAHLSKKLPSTRLSLSLVGDTSYWSNDYRDSLEHQITAHSLADRCFLLPHTSDPLPVYTAHDIFCHAAFQEPFGRTLAEAQACGLPVVAFNSGGVAEIVEHEQTGILVPYPDVNQFANALATLIIDPEQRKNMGARGRKRIALLFNREKQIPQITTYLHQTMVSGQEKI